MGATQKFSISLSRDLAELVEQKMESGDYSSVSDVFDDAVRALIDRDEAIESWLREQVLAGHAEYLADPAQAVPAEDLLASIKDRNLARG